MKILHVFTDSFFFESVSIFFDSLDNVDNLYLFYTKKKNYKFSKIRSPQKITVVHSYNDYVSNFHRADIDIIYFHSIHFKFYKYFKFIDESKIVIWWCFGTEIYSKGITNSTILPLKIYKPLTYSYLKSHLTIRERLISIFRLVFGWHYASQRKKAIERVDYFAPVLPQDYYMMKKWCTYLRAKPFMLECGPEAPLSKSFNYLSTPGNILVGHSLTYTTNLLDILPLFDNIEISKNRKILVPISYGKDYGGITNFEEMINNDNILWLDKIIPLPEYTELFKSITHAVFGMIRQQATGNVDLCICNGVKMFLYKDSIVYQYLKSRGYFVYTIEEDLTAEALITPLTHKEALHNYQLLQSKLNNNKEIAEKELKMIMDSKLRYK